MKTRIQFVRLAFEPVGLAGSFEFEHDGTRPIEELLERGFAAFNRDSGESVPYSGPSASGGDLFVVTNDDDFRFKEVWQIKSIGFRRIKCDVFDFQESPIEVIYDPASGRASVVRDEDLKPGQRLCRAWLTGHEPQAASAAREGPLTGGALDDEIPF